jgi:DNA invertase Pin-like site-specific DNA recombinase
VTLDGVSGVEVLSDPRFAALLARMAEPGIDGVVVADFDRLFRRGRWADFGILDAFADAGAVIYSSAGRIDPSDESGEWVAGVSGIMSGAERKRLLARTRRGKEENRRKGWRAEGDGAAWGMPRGVTFDHSTKRWSYVEPAASQVRAVFMAFLGGCHNLREIARRTKLGGADNAHGARVTSILRQPLYAGIYRVDRRWVKGKAKSRSADECYEVTVLDPPLVSSAEFERAQQILARLRASRPVRRQRGDLGVYHGFADCARCGGELWMQAPGGHGGAPAYICGARKRGCAQGHVAVTLADPVIDAALESRLGSEDVLRRLLDAAADEARTRRAPATDIGARLAGLHNRRARVLDGHEEGVYKTSEATKRLAALDGEIAALNELAGRDDAPVPVDAALVSELVSVFAEWRDLRREAKRRLLAAYRVRIALASTRRKHAPIVESVSIGSLSRDSVRVYKKMRRFGIE